MRDDKLYYSDRAASEFTLAAQAEDATVRDIHTELAEAYAQLAATMPASAEPRRVADSLDPSIMDHP
jgi:hypothetical protein